MYEIIIIIIIIIIIMLLLFLFPLVKGLFLPVLLLKQRLPPPLKLQVSDWTFRITCDVASIAVFCSESIECFPGMASKYFFKTFVSIPVAPATTCMVINFMLHIYCTSFLRHFA
jgi:hypothetical protein